MHRLKRASSRTSSTSSLVSIGEVDVSTLPVTFHLGINHSFPNFFKTGFLNEFEFFYYSGFSVPSILAILRNQLDFTDGLKEEGIFRICGKETEIANLLRDINVGAGMSNPNAHNAANLMKRWFNSWTGGKLFSGIPEQAFVNYKSLDLSDYLVEPKLSIWKWLLQLLVDIYAYREYNKMTAENIAIVWAPALINGIDTVKPDQIQSILLLNRYTMEYLEYLIINDGKSLPNISKAEATNNPNNDHVVAPAIVPKSPTTDSAPVNPLFLPNNPQTMDSKYPSLFSKTFTSASRPVVLLSKARETNMLFKSSPALLTTPPPPPPISPREITPAVRRLMDLAKAAEIPTPLCKTKPPPSLTTPNNL